MNLMDADCAIAASAHLQTLSPTMSELHEQGILYSVRQVYIELTFRKGASRVKTWAQDFEKQHPNFFLDRVDRNSSEYIDVQSIIRRPEVNPRDPQDETTPGSDLGTYQKYRIRRFNEGTNPGGEAADPFLVATALREGWTIITQESSKGSIKLPTVARAAGLPDPITFGTFLDRYCGGLGTQLGIP